MTAQRLFSGGQTYKNNNDDKRVRIPYGLGQDRLTDETEILWSENVYRKFHKKKGAGVRLPRRAVEMGTASGFRDDQQLRR